MADQQHPIRTSILAVTMKDGSVWGVPVEQIARSRANNYKDEFDNDVERSLAEDTWPLFEHNDSTVFDWACNNMYWSEMKDSATKISDAPPLTEADKEEGWENGPKEIIAGKGTA